ncbi:glycosyltransferase family 4 protein [Nitratireductor aquibiodomus]|uniref:glycosyltransferase family 4 protein n=1 Tax=Nitratireductor aquibiodomus TaxID=204799 RepID=UPI00031C1853|nr:glycosyltransferase family 1 protein [Nitratireductor aquibiodomus]
MAQRIKLGLPFNYDENWIGGAYYAQNLVSSFRLLPPEKQPDVFVLSHDRKSFEFIAQGSGYGRCIWVQPARLADIDGGIFRKLTLLQKIIPRILKRKMNFDIIYPFPIDRQAAETVCWIPDFQEKHLPHLFSSEELRQRDRQVRYFCENFGNIVFSSEAAENDFLTFYPGEGVKTHVVRFAVFNSNVSNSCFEEVSVKYGLPSRFFYCPNQFWVHKNHAIVLEALAKLKDNGVKVDVVFSGKEHDHRVPTHAQDLKDRARVLGVDDRAHFLGFLPRSEQVTLFRHAVAIVQPSLFEGWSTVIEDAKAISQFVIASNLAVNREQISQNVAFFDPHNATSLASLLSQYVDEDPERVDFDYTLNQREFAEDFLQVAESLRSSVGG